MLIVYTMFHYKYKKYKTKFLELLLEQKGELINEDMKNKIHPNAQKEIIHKLMVPKK